MDAKVLSLSKISFNIRACRNVFFCPSHINRTPEKQSSTSEESALFKNNMWYVLLVWMHLGTSVTQFPSCFYVTFTGYFPFPNTRKIHMRKPASFSLLKKNQESNNHKNSVKQSAKMSINNQLKTVLSLKKKKSIYSVHKRQHTIYYYGMKSFRSAKLEQFVILAYDIRI